MGVGRICVVLRVSEVLMSSGPVAQGPPCHGFTAEMAGCWVHPKADAMARRGSGAKSEVKRNAAAKDPASIDYSVFKEGSYRRCAKNAGRRRRAFRCFRCHRRVFQRHTTMYPTSDERGGGKARVRPASAPSHRSCAHPHPPSLYTPTYMQAGQL